jgi:DNA-binding FadR family transcriptional regulator
VVSGCLSYFDCRLHSLLEGGDHMIFVGQVVSAGGTDGEPLLYFDGGYRSLSPEQRSAQRSAETVEVGLSLLDLRPDELFDTQRAVEPVLAGLASERATASDLGRLESLLTEADACLDDPDRTTELGMDFHVALADIAGNRPLRATMSAVSHLERALLPEHTDPHRARKVLEIHRTIFEHVRDGRPELASRTMAEHVDEMNARLPG